MFFASVMSMFLLSSCNNNAAEEEIIDDWSVEEPASEDYGEVTTEFKYESISGSSYNYDIYGEDEYGNSVTGNVDIDGDINYGDGYIEDEYGNEKYIEVEWVDWGEMEGEDEDGVSYTLRVL